MRKKKYRVKKYLVFTVSILMMFGLLFVVGLANPEVTFTDPGLEVAVREKIGRQTGVIHQTDLRSITELDATGKGIRSLKGIGHLTKLVSLNLEDNRVEDVSELARLPMLKKLSLRNNGITDLEDINFEAIVQLDLRELSLRHNVVDLGNGEEVRLSDLSLLRGFEKLEVLELRDNHIVDISPLTDLRELVTLDLRQNPIRDFKPLTGMVKLTDLNLRETGITDLGLLERMPGLVHLNIHSNVGITSIRPLESLRALETLIMRDVPIGGQIDLIAGLTKLKRLNISGTGIGSIEALGAMTGLVQLELADNKVDDIARLSGMKDLEVLDLGNTGITDIGAIRGHVRMRELDLRNNGITDLSPIEGFTALTYLNLHSNTGILSVAPIADFISLETLIMRNVPVGDQAGVLAGLKKLKVVNLSHTGISDITALSGAVQMTHLEMSENEISDISPLAGMKHLEVLDLGSNRIGSVAALEGHVLIHDLDLRENEISDIMPLRALTSLRYLNLHSNNTIASIESIAGFTALETLILKHVPIGEQYPVFEGLQKLRRLNVENTGILDETVLARLQSEGSLVREDTPAYGVFDLKVPCFSQKGGLYSAAFELSLQTDEPSAAVHYTLDGSEPTRNSLRYTKALPIALDRVSVVRARVFAEDGRTSPTVTHTYFLNKAVFERNDLPFISIATAESNLFDPVTGIYADNNRWMEGMAWERPIHIEMYEDNGDLSFRQNAGIRIHGAYTRTLHQRSLKIYARPEYDNQNYFNAAIFPGLTDVAHGEPKDQFKRLVIRTSGNDYNSALFRDALTQSLVEPLKTMTTQAYRPAVLFVNGKYWGIHNIREMYGQHYLSSTFDVEEDEVVILENNGVVDEGEPEDARHYKDMLDYIRLNGLEDDVHYDYIRTQMDVENFRDYLIAETFFGNTDWPHNNVRYWRTKTEEYLPDAPYGKDGRWRWMLYDMDFSFSRHFIRVDRFGSTMDHTHDTLTWALSPYDGLYGGVTWPNFLFRAVMANAEFREGFINRYADLMNSYFEPDLVESRIDAMKEPIEPEIPDHIQRWGVIHSMGAWQQTIERMHEFARKRPASMRQHLVSQFRLGGTGNVAIESEPEKGHVQVNTLDLREGLPGYEEGEVWTGIYFRNVPITLTAKPQPGYRFSHWEGLDQESSDAVLKIALTGDVRVRAVFEKTD